MNYLVNFQPVQLAFSGQFSTGVNTPFSMNVSRQHKPGTKYLTWSLGKKEKEVSVRITKLLQRNPRVTPETKMTCRWIASHWFYGADTKNRTRDLLITKHIYNLLVFINQTLTTLATAKTNVTQPQLMVFQWQSGTNLAQSIFLLIGLYKFTTLSSTLFSRKTLSW